MKKSLLGLALLVLACSPAADAPAELAEWEAQADRITIIRDDWGVPHIYGQTDADAVFGMIYAQAEDDFNRIEVNFLNSQGRLAEAEGEDEIWRDLRMKLFIDPADMQAQYAASPQWLRDLMDAWADGLNYFLYTHPEVEPRVLTRFEPWMALTFSEGSIGGDIERVNLGRLQEFYEQEGGPMASLLSESRMAMDAPAGAVTTLPAMDAPRGAAKAHPAMDTSADRAADVAMDTPAPREFAGTLASSLVEPDPDEEPTGSNGIALAPHITESGNAMLLINPHTSFFFREELHMVSEEGLNAYGAVTWGQFFVYQGFNETSGWMHTSSGVDNIDEFAEDVFERDGQLFYRYGDEEREVETREVTVPYRTTMGTMAEREFTVYRTHHGPIVREADGRWISVALMEEPMDALIQSYARTKTANLDEYVASMRSHTNSSNNTVYADADGNIAYMHSNFIPIRDTQFNYLQPVDGSDPATDWQGVHTFEDTPNMLNPEVGWVQNTNNHPFSASGTGSIDRNAYPVYVQRSGENARGVHAIRLLEGRSGFTLQGLIDAAFSSYLPAFAESIPVLSAQWARGPGPSAEVRERLAEPVDELLSWDFRWGAESVATSLAVYWGEEMRRTGNDPANAFSALDAAVQRLEDEFGDWRTPWGEINRFQRINGDIVQPFSDDEPSTPVPFVSGRWGSLASFGSRQYPGTSRWYGTSGNSFVAVVEFGDRVRARAVTAGGLNSDPASPHFNDQSDRYASGDLRDVYFYPEDLEGHIEREYRPGR